MTLYPFSLLLNKTKLDAKDILQLFMHSVYMDIVGIHAFKASTTLVTMINLRLNMLTLHMFVDITFELAGIATVYTVPPSILSLHLTLYFEIYKYP